MCNSVPEARSCFPGAPDRVPDARERGRKAETRTRTAGIARERPGWKPGRPGRGKAARKLPEAPGRVRSPRGRSVERRAVDARGRPPSTGEAAFRDAGSLGRGGSLKIEVRQEGGGPARPPGPGERPRQRPQSWLRRDRIPGDPPLERIGEVHQGVIESRLHSKDAVLPFSRRCAMVHNTDAFDDLPCFHAHQ